MGHPIYLISQIEDFGVSHIGKHNFFLPFLLLYYIIHQIVTYLLLVTALQELGYEEKNHVTKTMYGPPIVQPSKMMPFLF